MIVTHEKINAVGGVRLAHFNNAEDLSKYCANGKHNQRRRAELVSNTKWAGGTQRYFDKSCKFGDVSYARKAEAYVENFANIALKDYDVDYEYNTQVGVLDYQAAVAGNPACMYGPAYVETERAPVHIYLDCWTSVVISARAMEMRGIAVLALAMALSVFRPVQVKIITGLMHTPSRTNVIMTTDVPTAPMDLSMASWMLGSPTFFRIGQLGAVWEVAGDSRPCGIPGLSNTAWQETKMAEWMAQREGVNDVVFLPRMVFKGDWEKKDYAIKWIKEQLARFTEQE